MVLFPANIAILVLEQVRRQDMPQHLISHKASTGK